MLEAQGLRKAYGGRAAVADVSLAVRPGEILGLLGPNGAGKSTTIGMIAGLVPPDAGRVVVDGVALDGTGDAYKRRIGLVPQDLALFEDLPARDNLELFGALYDLPRSRARERAARALDEVGLADRARDKPSTFSGGMKRRLNIACALVHDPDVILLDEPTAGVDPQSRNAIFDHLERLKRDGKALVYTTHYMEEAERLADRIVVVDHGAIVASGTLRELLARLPAAQTLTLDVEGPIDAGTLRGIAGVKDVRVEGGRVVLAADDLARVASAALAAVVDAGASVRHVSSDRGTLEDVFLALTGRELRD